MPINYTNRKGQTYTLYKGQTRTGKPRYYFGRAGQGQGEPVTELPPGYTISESVNGVVSLVKDRPSLIRPEEVAAIEDAVKQLPDAKRYRVAAKHDYIEVYERISPDASEVLSAFPAGTWFNSGKVAKLQSELERKAQYTPIFRFTLLDEKRCFGVQRMCYRSSVNGWLKLFRTGPITKLAHELIPTLGTDDFFELI
jgi:hypothetical protein